MTNRFLASVYGLLAVLAMGLAPAVSPTAKADEADRQAVMSVWKTPTCGCCGIWVDHMRDAGFRLDVTDLDDVSPVKVKHGITPQLSSCHTAVVDGYVIEGHVPAEDVRRLLRERPDILGIAVPGMPAGSPGMESPHPQPYDVLALGRDGKTRVFSSHEPLPHKH